ncbi:hypothetical protein VT25_01295 [Photobacterium leiognathi subsp. mandapamensis]|nr:hypothetical protein VT25_01295 [Photobacterium leiognathi subsp. mandapamensis]
MKRSFILLFALMPFSAVASLDDGYKVTELGSKAGLVIIKEYGVFAINNADNGHEHRPAKFKLIANKPKEIEFDVIETTHGINKGDVTIVFNGNHIGKGEGEVKNVQPDIEHKLGLQLFNVKNADYPAGTVLKVVVRAKID